MTPEWIRKVRKAEALQEEQRKRIEKALEGKRRPEMKEIINKLRKERK